MGFFSSLLPGNTSLSCWICNGSITTGRACADCKQISESEHINPQLQNHSHVESSRLRSLYLDEKYGKEI